MGWEWEVEGWTTSDTGNFWQPAYRGDSKRRARKAEKLLRERGIKCIRTTWRPA